MSAVIASLSGNIMDDLPPFLNTSDFFFFNNEYVLLLQPGKSKPYSKMQLFWR